MRPPPLLPAHHRPFCTWQISILPSLQSTHICSIRMLLPRWKTVSPPPLILWIIYHSLVPRHHHSPSQPMVHCRDTRLKAQRWHSGQQRTMSAHTNPMGVDDRDDRTTASGSSAVVQRRRVHCTTSGGDMAPPMYTEEAFGGSFPPSTGSA